MLAQHWPNFEISAKLHWANDILPTSMLNQPYNHLPMLAQPMCAVWDCKLSKAPSFLIWSWPQVNIFKTWCEMLLVSCVAVGDSWYDYQGQAWPWYPLHYLNINQQKQSMTDWQTVGGTTKWFVCWAGTTKTDQHVMLYALRKGLWL